MGRLNDQAKHRIVVLRKAGLSFRKIKKVLELDNIKVTPQAIYLFLKRKNIEPERSSGTTQNATAKGQPWEQAQLWNLLQENGAQNNTRNPTTHKAAQTTSDKRQQDVKEEGIKIVSVTSLSKDNPSLEPPTSAQRTVPQGQTMLQGQTMPHGQTVSQGQAMSHGQMVSQGQAMPHGQTVSQGQTMKHGQTVSQGQAMSHGQMVSQGQAMPHGQSVPRGQTVPQGHAMAHGQTAPQGPTVPETRACTVRPVQQPAINGPRPSSGLPASHYQLHGRARTPLPTNKNPALLVTKKIVDRAISLQKRVISQNGVQLLNHGGQYPVPASATSHQHTVRPVAKPSTQLKDVSTQTAPSSSPPTAPDTGVALKQLDSIRGELHRLAQVMQTLMERQGHWEQEQMRQRQCNHQEVLSQIQQLGATLVGKLSQNCVPFSSAQETDPPLPDFGHFKMELL